MKKKAKKGIDPQVLKNMPRVLRKFYEIKKETEEESEGSPSRTN